MMQKTFTLTNHLKQMLLLRVSGLVLSITYKNFTEISTKTCWPIRNQFGHDFVR